MNPNCLSTTVCFLICVVSIFCGNGYSQMVVTGPGLTDFDSNVDGSAVFTHAINIGTGAIDGSDDVTVNGVIFDGHSGEGNFAAFPEQGTDAQSGNTFSISGKGNFNFQTGGPGSLIAGDSAAFAAGLGAIDVNGTDLIISLDGLTSGTEYQLNLYYLSWDGVDRTANLLDGGLDDEDDQGDFISDPFPGPGGAENRTGTIVTYNYSAEGTTHDFIIRGAVPNSHPHLHAFSNQLADKLLVGDVNCDGVINLLDVTPFVEAVTSGEFDPKADINQDGSVNLLDVGPFVELVSG